MKGFHPDLCECISVQTLVQIKLPRWEMQIQINSKNQTTKSSSSSSQIIIINDVWCKKKLEQFLRNSIKNCSICPYQVCSSDLSICNSTKTKSKNETTDEVSIQGVYTVHTVSGVSIQESNTKRSPKFYNRPNISPHCSFRNIAQLVKAFTTGVNSDLPTQPSF